MTGSGSKAAEATEIESPTFCSRLLVSARCHLRRRRVVAEQQAKFERFKALHQRDAAFVIPVPWDAGSARILTRASVSGIWQPLAPAMPFQGQTGFLCEPKRGEILDITGRRSSGQPIFPYRPILRTALVQRRRSAPKRSGWPLRLGWSADRSKMPPAIRQGRSMISRRPSSAYRPRRRRRGSCLSRQRRGRRIFSGSGPISMTRSSGCRLSRQPAPMCSMRPVCPISTPSEPSAPRSTSPSMW